MNLVTNFLNELIRTYPMIAVGIVLGLSTYAGSTILEIWDKNPQFSRAIRVYFTLLAVAWMVIIYEAAWINATGRAFVWLGGLQVIFGLASALGARGIRLAIRGIINLIKSK